MTRDENQVRRLVRQAQKGDKEAFGAIYDEYFDRIYAYIAWRVSSRSEAEDLTQNVFIRVLEALPRYRYGEAPFAAWIFRIAHNLLANYYRDTGRAQTVDLEEMAGTLKAIEDPEESALKDITAAHVRGALGELTEDQQQVIVMKFMGDLSNEEIATALGKPVGAVKSLQHRGLARLGRTLGGGDGDE